MTDTQKPISLPLDAASARLRELAEIIRKEHDEAAASIDELCDVAPDGFHERILDLQDTYWKHVVGPHLAEIASLTNNSASNLSTFAPNHDRYWLGGITPESLTLLADEGMWRKRT